MILLGVITMLVVSISQTQAGFNDGIVYPFPPDELLTCYLRNKDGSLRPESPPTIPLGTVVRQPNANGTLVDVWLPLESGYIFPPTRFPQFGGINEERLLIELRKDPGYNDRVTSVRFPAGPPPRACEILPAFEGSGGQQRIHISEDEDPIPLLMNQTLEDGTNTFDVVANDMNVPTLTAADWRTARDPPIMRDFILAVERAILQDGNGVPIQDTGTNDIEELWDIWIAKCPLEPLWAELPEGYFPKFFAQGTCSGKNCSFPRGLFCEEDFSYLAFTTVLRWDCCFNPDRFNPYAPQRWECGWRRVRIPFVCDCFCGCTERHPHF